ncbi:MAG: cytochrome c [Phycisphaerae bacterium]|nr:cytochrome c [Phycisphaerae bacterium]
MLRKTRVLSTSVPGGTHCNNRDSLDRRRVRLGLYGWCAGLCVTILLVGLVGCGTNLEAVVAQTGNATATTMLDMLLTDFANSVAYTFEQYNQPSPPDGDGDANGDAVDGNGGDGSDGASLYAADCASCHGDDGASGFAPDVTGMADAELTDGLASSSHGAITLTDEEIAAISEFLGGGGDDGSGGDDAALDGAELFATNCASCHGADGFAPDITGLTAEEMAGGLTSGVHSSISLTEEEVAAITDSL